MIEKIYIAGIAALFALIIREIVVWYRLYNRGQKLAEMCVKHLNQIQHDLTNHLSVSQRQNRRNIVIFKETNYWEIVVGDFLYDLIASNIDSFPNVDSFDKTITFFHHYKVNMSTVRARMDSIPDGELPPGQERYAALTEGTYNNLLKYLQEAIDELNNLKRPIQQVLLDLIKRRMPYLWWLLIIMVFIFLSAITINGFISSFL